MGVLLHQQNGDARLVELPDDVEDLLHQNGRKPHGRLVQHQQPGAGHQPPAHSQHLLLTTGQGAGHLTAALLQPGKLPVHPLQAGFNGGAGLGIGPHLQVFLHRHLLEDAPPLGDVGHTQLHDLVGGEAGQVLSQKLHRAGAGAEQTAHRVQNGGLARAVGPDEGDHLALADLEGHALDGVDGAVIDVNIVYLQHIRVPLTAACPDKPR